MSFSNPLLWDTASFTKLSLIKDSQNFSEQHKIEKPLRDLTCNDVNSIMKSSTETPVMFDALALRFEKNISGANNFESSKSFPIIFVEPTQNLEFVTFQPEKIVEDTDSADNKYRSVIGTVRIFEAISKDVCGVDVYSLKTKRTNITANYVPTLGYVCDHLNQYEGRYGNVYLHIPLKPCMGYALYKC